MKDFAADIPESLQDADELLTRYGRWAANSGRSARTCGSAEGGYRPGAGDALQARREASGQVLTQAERQAAQHALARVPETERLVLVVLYVPRRQPIGMQFRLMGVPARLTQERHLVGLRIWWNLYQAARRASA